MNENHPVDEQGRKTYPHSTPAPGELFVKQQYGNRWVFGVTSGLRLDIVRDQVGAWVAVITSDIEQAQHLSNNDRWHANEWHSLRDHLEVFGTYPPGAEANPTICLQHQTEELARRTDALMEQATKQTGLADQVETLKGQVEALKAQISAIVKAVEALGAATKTAPAAQAQAKKPAKSTPTTEQPSTPAA